MMCVLFSDLLKMLLASQGNERSFQRISASCKGSVADEMPCCQTRNHQDPLFRFFEREVKMGGKMLQDVRQDLSDVVQVCQGKKKQTNNLRTLISDLVKGTHVTGVY